MILLLNFCNAHRTKEIISNQLMKLRQQELTGDGGRPGQVGGGRRQSCRTDVSSGGVAARPGGDRRQHADDSHQPADRRRR